MKLPRVFSRSIFPGLVLLVAGCGGDCEVDGKFTNNHQPYSARDRESLTLTFEQLEGDRLHYSAAVGKDGSFRLAKPLPCGKYRVCVVHRPDYGTYMPKYRGFGMGQIGGGGDRFNGAFQGAQSPLTVQLKRGAAHLVIDVSRRTVTEG